MYGYAENPSMTLKEALAQLDMSCKATRSLYLFMLSVISPLTSEAKARIDAARSKFNPTEEEKHPNLKFVQNSIAPILENDPDFCKAVSREKLSWEQYDVFLRKLYDSIKSKQYFADYMADPQSDIKQDAELFVKIFEEEFVDNADLAEILEDMSIYWIDDLAYALTFCCKTVTSLAAGARWALPPLYQSEMRGNDGMDSDRDFVTKLLRCAFTAFPRYNEMVAGAVPKWDKERLFTVDVVLIICGLAEAQYFEEIPVKVSINEYVEISKFYSTPKSRSFVNGILDRLIQQMTEEGLITKSGKGLL